MPLPESTPPRPSPFGARMAEWVKRTGKSHTALAEEIGVNRAAVSQWVGGWSGPDPRRLDDVARVLGLTRDESVELFELCGVTIPEVVLSSTAAGT